MNKSNSFLIGAIFLLLMVVFSIFYFVRVNGFTTAYATGEKEQISLRAAKGLEITLAENSTYRVDSVGEGYGYISFSGKMMVQLDEDNPFLWNFSTKYGVVVAKNAGFLLRESPDHLEVIVASGDITLYRLAGSSVKDGLNIATGEIASINRVGGGVRKRINRNKNFLSWHTKVFVFEATRLSEVANILSEAYQFQVNLASDALGQCLYSGRFSGQSLQEIIDLISQRFGLTFEKNDIEYMLEGRGC